jgi:hypothetical protein
MSAVPPDLWHENYIPTLEDWQAALAPVNELSLLANANAYTDAALTTAPLLKGNIIKAGTQGWLQAMIGAGTENAIGDGGILSLSPTGHPTLVVGSRTGDMNNPAMGGPDADWFTSGFFAINNNTTVIQNIMCAYMEGRRFAGTGSVQTAELNAINFGTLVRTHPYLMGAVGYTANLWLSLGRSDVGTVSLNSCVLGIAYNGAQAETGIVFDYRAIFDQTDVGAKAIQLATRQAVVWTNSAGNPNAVIRSDSNVNAGSPAAIVFDDDGLSLYARNGSRQVALGDAGVQFTGPVALDGGVTVTNGPIVTDEPLLIAENGTTPMSHFRVSAPFNPGGATLSLEGNGPTTPRKFIRARSGNLEVVNDANTAIIASLSDVGELTVVNLAIGTAIAPTATGGSASLVPAAPIGYATIKVGGTACKVALYNV